MVRYYSPLSPIMVSVALSTIESTFWIVHGYDATKSIMNNTPHNMSMFLSMISIYSPCKLLYRCQVVYCHFIITYYYLIIYLECTKSDTNLPPFSLQY